MQQGTLFIISAASGTGKTSLVNALLNELPNIKKSVSYTTRTRRGEEVNGRDYFFVDEITFKKMIEEKAFLEYAHVFKHYYGTSKKAVDDDLKQGIDVILEIDWQGAEQVRKLMPQAKSIFILPPSLEALKQRILDRNEDPLSAIKIRLEEASKEISHCFDFDYLILNDDFDKAFGELKSIFIAARCETKNRRNHFGALIKELI